MRNRLAMCAHQRPAVVPVNRLQMDDAPVNPGVLKMHEPPVAVRRVHQRALMRAVDDGATLRQHNFIFVRPVNIFRAQHDLPAGRHAASGREDVIPAILLQKLRAFERVMFFRIVENNFAFAQKF